MPFTIAGVNSFDDKPVASANHRRLHGKGQHRVVLRQHRHNVLVKRLARSRPAPCSGPEPQSTSPSPAAPPGRRSRQMADRGAPSASPSSRPLDQRVHRLFGSLCARAHQHNHPLRIRRAVIIEQVISAARRAAKRSITYCTIPGTAAWKGLQASRAWKNTSGFCAVPRIIGRSGLSALCRKSIRYLSSTIARIVSSPMGRILPTSCEVRKPSKK